MQLNQNLSTLSHSSSSSPFYEEEKTKTTRRDKNELTEQYDNKTHDSVILNPIISIHFPFLPSFVVVIHLPVALPSWHHLYFHIPLYVLHFHSPTGAVLLPRPHPSTRAARLIKQGRHSPFLPRAGSRACHAVLFTRERHVHAIFPSTVWACVTCRCIERTTGRPATGMDASVEMVRGRLVTEAMLHARRREEDGG